MGAAHAENAHFSYSLVSAPTTRFLGNSLEIFPNGRTRVTLKHCGETFTHTPPQVRCCDFWLVCVFAGLWARSLQRGTP